MKASFKEPEIHVELFSVEPIMADSSYTYGEDDTPITPFGNTPAIEST